MRNIHLRYAFSELPHITKRGILTLFFLIMFQGSSFASLQEKEIALNIKNASLVDVLNKIKSEAKCEIFYLTEDVAGKGDVTISNNKISIDEILKRSLDGTGLVYSYDNNKIVISKRKNETTQLLPQTQKVEEEKEITVNGSVIDSETTKPLAGALISVVGTTRGAITDFDGRFSLKANESEEIEITFVGMITQTIKLQGKGTKDLNILMLRDIQAIDDVIVVGYGTRKKEHMTGAVEVIKGERLAQQATNRLDEAIMGQTAGVFVSQNNADPSAVGEVMIRVRGVKGNDAAPLLVIDGTPRFGTLIGDGEMRLSDINPNDVESITILKDAAAAAIYGSRAANGVILVTTKRGDAARKLAINYTGKGNFQQAVMMPNFLNGYEFAKLYNVAVNNTPGTQNKVYTTEQLEEIRTGSNPDIYASEDLADYLKEWGYSTSHSLSLSGGSKAISYYASGALTSTSGLYDGIKNNRYSYNLRLDAQLIDGLTLSFDVMGSGSSSKNPSYQTINSLYNFSPLQPLVWENGSWVSIGGGNPLIGINGMGGYNENNSDFNTITARLNYDLDFVTKGLSVYAKGAFDNNLYETRAFSSPVKLYNRETSVVDGREVVTYPLDSRTVYPKGKTTASDQLQTTKNMLVEAGANYNRTFEKNSISAMLIFNYQQNKWTKVAAENKDMQSNFPEFVGNAGTIGRGLDYLSQRASLVGRINYSYDNRYVVEGSFRYDGSTKFSPGNRWGIFPTASVAWNIVHEKFFKDWNQEVLSNIKFRASTGLLGNDGAIDNFSYLYRYILGNESYQIGTTPESPGLMVETGEVPNEILKWGKSHDWNFGVDLGLFDNRLTAIFEYYMRFNTNDIRPTPLHLYPPSIGTGGVTPYQNFGKTKTWGYDLTIGWRDRIGEDATYFIDVMMSRSWDKVIDAGDESSLPDERKLAGKPVSSSWMYISDGLFQSQEEIDNHPVDQDGKKNSSIVPGDIRYKDFNGDNVLGKDDERAFEYVSIPDYAINVRLGVTYKGFFMNALLQGALNYKKDISDSYTLESNSLPRFQEYHLEDSWTPENTHGTLPVVKFASTNDNNRKKSDYWYRNASFIRLKTLNIGYTLPSRYLKNVKLSSLSMALQGGNLFTGTNLKGIDPDTNRGYPITRTYGVTLNIGF